MEADYDEIDQIIPHESNDQRKMTATEGNKSLDEPFGSSEAKQRVLKDLDLHMTSIERYLESQGHRVPTKNHHFETKVAEQLSDSEFQDLINQFKYAGRQTIHYFIIKGISDHDLDEIRESVESRLAEENEVAGVLNEPFLADSERLGSRLYLPIGYHESAGSQDPITGRTEPVQITKRVVAVVKEGMDLVEIRGSNVSESMVELIRDEICKSLGKYKDSVKGRPNFGPEFQEQFNEIVELYTNLKVRVDDSQETTLDTISFTSREDEEGNRKDARQDDRVEAELDERGGEITMGYVEVSEGFRFRINREKSKITFVKSEHEESINQVTKIIDDVLRQTRGYTQGTLSGLDDVSE